MVAGVGMGSLQVLVKEAGFVLRRGSASALPRASAAGCGPA